MKYSHTGPNQLTKSNRLNIKHLLNIKFVFQSCHKSFAPDRLAIFSFQSSYVKVRIFEQKVIVISSNLKLLPKFLVLYRERGRDIWFWANKITHFKPLQYHKRVISLLFMKNAKFIVLLSLLLHHHLHLNHSTVRSPRVKEHQKLNI